MLKFRIGGVAVDKNRDEAYRYLDPITDIRSLQGVNEPMIYLKKPAKRRRIGINSHFGRMLISLKHATSLRQFVKTRT